MHAPRWLVAPFPEGWTEPEVVRAPPSARVACIFGLAAGFWLAIGGLVLVA